MAKWVSGGVTTVSTHGVPVQLTTDNILAYSVLFQSLPFNTNRVVIGADSGVRAGAATVTNPSGNVLAILGKGSSTETPPSGGARVTGQPHGILLSALWLDAVTDGEGIIWSYLLA
jgi:hypothetical protein